MALIQHLLAGAECGAQPTLLSMFDVCFSLMLSQFLQGPYITQALLHCFVCRPVFVSSSQVDYMPELQTNINNGLLKVVLAPGTAVPRLFFTVSSLLLTAKSDVTACIPVGKLQSGSHWGRFTLHCDS